MTQQDPKNSSLLQAVNDRTMSAADRAQIVVFNITQSGQDFLPTVTKMIQDNDEAAKVTDMVRELGEDPLISERYIGPANVNGVGKLGCAVTGINYAWVTTRDSVTCLPCDIKELQQGDVVLINAKMQRIVAKDGDLAATGYVASVESVPEGSTGQVVIKTRGDESQLAWLHHKLLDSPPKPGSKVIYDERHRFVLSSINTDTKGDELLSSLATLPTVRRADVGSPHPIAAQVVNHFRDALEHPDWVKQLGSRDRKGYLFVGQTGGGKSYHIKLIATEVHDLIEQHTGQRTSRVFICDASQFWSPYFGETEQKITSWANKISALGSQKIKGQDGKEVAVPLLGVIEECEALFRSRGGDQHASGHLFDRVLALLLQKLESVENAIGVPIVWVCSTNRADLIDAAAMRRIGMRKAIFGNLDAEAANLVMLTKLKKLKCNSQKLASEVIKYLYENEEGQGLARVTLEGGKTRTLKRCHLVTPAILEEAVSFAVDQCLEKSREAGALQKVESGDVVQFLGTHFNHLSRMLTADNVPEYCPEWFAENSVPVMNVQVIR